MSTATLPTNLALKQVNESAFASQRFARAPDLTSLPYEPKPVSIGMVVNFYRGCNPSVKPIPAVVIEVAPRGVTLASWYAAGVIGDRPIRHISDPLTLNDFEKQQGGWDYTDDYKERMVQRETLKTIISVLNHLGECVNKIASEAGMAMPEYMGAKPFPEEAASDVPEISEEERARQAAELEAAMDEEPGELATENESLPASERVHVGGGRRRR